MALYSSQFGDVAGIGTAKETYENAFSWGRKESGLITNFVIDGSARDTGNTGTTFTLRPGLVLGVITASGNLRDYGASNTDGSQVAIGVLLESLRVTDIISNANSNKMYGVLVGGPVQASKLLGLDDNARANMFGRFVFDDDFFGNRLEWKQVAKAANYTVVVGDRNTHFFATTGAVTFTLPAAEFGAKFRFTQTTDNNMAITAPANKFITDGANNNTTVTYSTASHKIGSSLEVVPNNDGTKWCAINIGGTTATYT